MYGEGNIPERPKIPEECFPAPPKCLLQAIHRTVIYSITLSKLLCLNGYRNRHKKVTLRRMELLCLFFIFRGCYMTSANAFLLFINQKAPAIRTRIDTNIKRPNSGQSGISPHKVTLLELSTKKDMGFIRINIRRCPGTADKG